jgi:hypothetical protein
MLHDPIQDCLIEIVHESGRPDHSAPLTSLLDACSMTSRFAEKLAQEAGLQITVRDAEGIKLCIAPIKLSS